MKISIPVKQNRGFESYINEHFGKTPFFAFIEIKDNGHYDLIIEKNPLESHKPGDVPRYLSHKNVNKVIVNNIGNRAIGHFQQFGIDVIKGAKGNLENILKPYLKNNKKH